MKHILILLALIPLGARAAEVLTKVVPDRAEAPLVKRVAELWRGRAPVVLMGAPGERPRAVARGLASDAAVFALDVAARFAGAADCGEVERRLSAALARFTDEPDRVLFIENLAALLNERDLAALLTGVLGRIKLLTVLTPSQFSTFAGTHPSFTNRLAIIDLPADREIHVAALRPEHPARHLPAFR